MSFLNYYLYYAVCFLACGVLLLMGYKRYKMTQAEVEADLSYQSLLRQIKSSTSWMDCYELKQTCLDWYWANKPYVRDSFLDKRYKILVRAIHFKTPKAVLN